MQYNRVASLSNGTCVKIDNSLVYRVKSITFELEKDKKYEDHISISNARELYMDGYAYSDNNRVIIKNSVIKEKKEDIFFTIDTTDLKYGDRIIGNLSIITNVGVANIPFEYSIIANTTIKMIDGLETITDFYDYLCTDFDTARSLFTDKYMIRAPFMQDEFTMSVYEGLINGSDKDIALIEFFKAFEIDITNLYKNVDSDALKIYFDDTLDNIDLSSIRPDNPLNKALTFNSGGSESLKRTSANYEDAKELIDIIADKELLTVLASMCVRSGFTDELSFKIYWKVIEKGSNIHGIYDVFLNAIPNDYDSKLPLYIYRYYYDDKTYSFDDKSRLYENIIAVFDENDNVYKMYSNEILEFAISCIYQNRITESLIKIYNKVLSEKIINENNHNNVLYLLRSHKIIINNKRIKKVIIKYVETDKETKYDVVNSIVYIPIFFGSRVIFYEDQYGNRFYSEDVNIQILFDRKDLESYIISNFPQKDIIDMTKVIKLNETESFNREYEVEEVRSLESKLKINRVIKNKYEKKIIDFYFRQVMSKEKLSDNAIEYLKKLLFYRLDVFDKRKMLKIMIECEQYKYTYEKVSFYGLDLMEDSDLLKLFYNCIDIGYDDIKTRLLNDILTFIKNGNKDTKLCNYMSSNYDGSIDNMIFVMDSIADVGLDTSYIAKKLLMLSLESNEIEYLDHIFDMYDIKNDENDDLVVAYLNKKATDYFLDDVETDKKYFEKLEQYFLNHFDNIDSMPVVFLFAITKFISTFKVLMDNELRRILIKSMERLLKTEYVFAYYKKLNRHMRMPYYIMNKEYIEYHADKDFVPKVTISISGDSEKKSMELNKVFMNIYIKKITVFKNEIINYEITNANDPAAGILEKGTLTYDENYELEYPKSSKLKTTFDFINDAIVCIDRDNIEGLKKVVLEMVEKQEMSKELFNI